MTVSEELAAATGADRSEQCEGQAHTYSAYKRWAWPCPLSRQRQRMGRQA